MRGFNLTGDVLQEGNRYQVIAGGEQDLSACGFARRGYAISRPDFELRVTGMARYGRLRLSVEGECDTLLLVNGTQGGWYLDDNSYGNDPMIEFNRNLEGTYDVWVATAAPQPCAAVLVVQSR